MSHAETAAMESVESSAAKLVLSDETNASILIEKPVEQDQIGQTQILICHAGWCKNTCSDGNHICDECTRMMDSYP